MKLLRFFIPRIEYLLLAAVFWGVAASGPKILNFDGDLPRHILTGRLILQTQRVFTTDIFSFRTVSYPSIPHEWFSQVLFAGTYDRFGLDGIIMVTALVIMLTGYIVYSQALRRSTSLFASLIFTILAISAIQIHVLPRPHIFTYVLTAIWITLLERIDHHRRHTWWTLPLVMIVWVNVHGMFVIGILIWGIYMAGDFLDHPSRAWFSSTKARNLMVGGVLSVATTFFSPSGPAIWKAIAALGSNGYITSKIPEYQSANFHLPETWPFIIILLLVIIGFARTTQSLSWIYTLVVAAFTGLALYSSRMIPIFAIVVAPIAAELAAHWIRNEFPRSRFLVTEKNIYTINLSSNGLVWILITILTVGMLFNANKPIDPNNQGNKFDERFFPVEATKWLQDHPQRGRMFNEFDWGGYLLLNLWPDQEVFMDGSTHIYGEELTREYEQVITMDVGWEDILAKYDVTWVILRANAPLARTLSTSGDWNIVYSDPTSSILVRK